MTKVISVMPVTSSLRPSHKNEKEAVFGRALRKTAPQTMSHNDSTNRRGHVRIKVSVPVEIQTDASPSPIRGATADLSESGCYIETIYPFPIGTDLDMQLSLETIVLAAATVVTCDPQVGNGIRFYRMLPEDRKSLEAFLEAAQKDQDSGSMASSDVPVTVA